MLSCGAVESVTRSACTGNCDETSKLCGTRAKVFPRQREVRALVDALQMIDENMLHMEPSVLPFCSFKCRLIHPGLLLSRAASLPLVSLLSAAGINVVQPEHSNFELLKYRLTNHTAASEHFRLIVQVHTVMVRSPDFDTPLRHVPDVDGR